MSSNFLIATGIAGAAFFLNTRTLADSIKPLNFGPFFQNELRLSGDPTGYEYVLTNLMYRFQVGWIEPLGEGTKGIFRETYFETDGNFNTSPFETDFGTTFLLKPLRYFEFGLNYSRMLFHNSMVAIRSSNSETVAPEIWRPDNVIDQDHKEPGGADVFTFQGNFTLNLGASQIYLAGYHAFWDIDAKGKDFVYEYANDILIKPRDRVTNVFAQYSVDLRPYSLFKSVSFRGIALQDQYWYAWHTGLEKNLLSLGITGFRSGRDPERQRRGLDLSVGYWTVHDQLPNNDWVKSIAVLADWKWNIQFLKI